MYLHIHFKNGIDCRYLIVSRDISSKYGEIKYSIRFILIINIIIASNFHLFTASDIIVKNYDL